MSAPVSTSAHDRDATIESSPPAVLRGRVAIVISGDTLSGSGGAERRFIRIWSHLVARGGDCLLIANESLFRSAVAAGLCPAGGGREHAIIVPDAGSIRLSLSMYRAVRRSRCQLVHLPLAQRQLILFYALLHATPGLKRTHTIAAVWYAHPMKLPFLRTLLSRWLWKMSHRIDSLYEGFVELYARPRGFEHKVTVSPCSFTDVSRYSGTRRKEISIVFAGALHEQKNPLLLVEALRRLHAAGVSFRAVIAGMGPLRDTIRDSIKSFGLRDRVTVGSFPDMSEIFARSSIFVSLQRMDNYPSQALLEAMVARNAVVATREGETHKLVREGQTGLLIRPDAGELTDALAFLLQRPEMLRQMGDAAHDLVVNEHRIDRFADYIVGVWNRAMEGD